MVIKTISKIKKCKKAKWLSEKGLQIAEKRRDVKGKGEKEIHIHLNAEFQRIARRDKKAFFSVTGQGIDLDHCDIELLTLETKRRQGSRPFPWKSNAKYQNGWLRRPYK